LYLEYKVLIQKEHANEISFKLLGYTISAYGYENLRILFIEIFIKEEYQYLVNLPKNCVIADCGANIGLATLYLKHKFPSCTIHAFEPDKKAFHLLQKNIEQNKIPNVVLHNVAVMDKEGTINFYTAKDTPASLMMSSNPERMNDILIEVPGIDFSSFVAANKPAALKIDIEGAEQDVIRHLSETNMLNIFEQIVMEYHHNIEGQSRFSEMLSLLERNNFNYNIVSEFDKAGSFQDILLYAYRNKAEM
jgi:FkbM family methyltransferase